MEFLSLVSKYGTGPLLVILIVVVILLMKEHRKAHEEADQEMKTLAASMSSTSKQMADEMEKQLKIRDEANNLLMAKFDARLTYVEQNYAEKTYVQEAVSGWRTEIKDLGRRIDDYNKRVDRIMENRK